MVRATPDKKLRRSQIGYYCVTGADKVGVSVLAHLRWVALREEWSPCHYISVQRQKTLIYIRLPGPPMPLLRPGVWSKSVHILSPMQLTNLLRLMT